MSPLHFNSRTAKIVEVPADELVICDVTIELVPLGELLVAEQFPYNTGEFPRIKLGDWDRDKGIEFGRLITPELAALEPPAPFSKKIVERLHTLGVFPDFNYIRKHFDTLRNYVVEIDAKPTYDYSEYDKFSDSELLQLISKRHIEMLTDRGDAIPDKPLTMESLQALEAMGLAPSRKYLIRRHLNGVRTINRKLGHMDVRSWDNKTYMRYGHAMLKHFGPNGLTVANAEYLAREGKGPYPAAMKRQFDTWSAFQEQSKISYAGQFAKNPELQEPIDRFFKNQYSAAFERTTFDERLRNFGLHVLMHRYMRTQPIPLPAVISPFTAQKIIDVIKIGREDSTILSIDAIITKFSILVDESL